MSQTKVERVIVDDGFVPVPLIPERPLVPIALTSYDLPLPLTDSDNMEA